MGTDKPITTDLNSILEIEKKFKTQKKKLLEEMSLNTEKIKETSLKNIKELKKQLSEVTSIEYVSESQSDPVNAELKSQAHKELSKKMSNNIEKAEQLLDKFLFS
jgi:phage terminase small subunit